MTGIRELFVTHMWPDLAYDCEKVHGRTDKHTIDGLSYLIWLQIYFKWQA